MTAPAKICSIEIEEYNPHACTDRSTRGWFRRTESARTEFEAFRRGRLLQRRRDVREVRIVIAYADGTKAKYTLKARFPRAPKPAPAEWLAQLGQITREAADVAA